MEHRTVEIDVVALKTRKRLVRRQPWQWFDVKGKRWRLWDVATGEPVVIGKWRRNQVIDVVVEAS